MRSTLYMKVIFTLLKPFPIRKKTVLFKSFDGQYNDNPKAISEVLYTMAPSIQQIWLAKKDNASDFPGYVRQVRPNTFEYFMYAAKSQVVVENMTGIRGVFLRKENIFFKKLLKDKRQLNISTWHGTPLKRIGYDTPGNHKKKVYYSSSDYVTGSSDYFRTCFQTAYPNLATRAYGYPRNDCLVVRTVNKEEVERRKQKLRLPPKRVILFAPTFRESVYESGVRQMKEMDVPKLISACEKKFGGEWIFVYRVHHEVQKEISLEKLSQKKPGMIFDGNVGQDMADYLCVADILITDFSGSLFDFAITGKPCFLYAPDRERYENIERGFYLPIDSLPYSMSEDSDGLYRQIALFDRNAYEKGVTRFLQTIGSVHDGKASTRVAKDIISFCEEKNEEKTDFKR